MMPSETVRYYRLCVHIGGLVQDCSISRALAMEILQSCTKSSIYHCLVLSSMAKTVRCNCPSMPQLQRSFKRTTVEGRVCMKNYIPSKSMEVITAH